MEEISKAESGEIRKSSQKRKSDNILPKYEASASKRVKIKDNIENAQKSKSAKTLNIFQCDICGEKKEGKHALDMHMDSHRNLTCNVCNAKYSNRAIMKYHLQSHYENHVCQYCGYSTSKIKIFKYHMEKHEPLAKKLGTDNVVVTFPCRWCGLEFDKALNRSAHELRLHKGRTEEVFKCKICSKVCRHKDEFRLHTFEHYTGKLRSCEFEGCNKYFTAAKSLTVHMRSHFPAQFQCECGQRFKQRSGLYKHKTYKRCKKGAQPLPSPTAEELERHANMARQQFEELGGRIKPCKNIDGGYTIGMKKRYFKKPLVRIEDFKQEADSDTSLNDDLATEPKQQLEIEPIAKVEIKIEKHENCDNNDEWQYEYLEDENYHSEQEDSPASAVNDIHDSMPIVLLERLDRTEISMWKKIKDVSDESAEARQEENLIKIVKKRKSHKKLRKLNLKVLNPHRGVSEGAMLLCDFCGVGFRYKSDLRFHFHSHNRSKSMEKYKCKYGFCTEKFSRRDHLKKHQTKVHGMTFHRGSSKVSRSVICDLCSKSFAALHLLRVHISTTHKPEADIECPKCPAKFKSSTNLGRHLKTVHDKLTYSFACDVCGYLAKQQYILDRHMEKHGPPKECPICHRFVSALRSHVSKHRVKDSQTFLPCPDCGKMYDKYLLQAHINRVHLKLDNGNIFRCITCNIDFTRREDLRKHDLQEHYDGTLFECFCGSIFKSSKALRCHKFSHEPQNKKCPLCERTYARNASLWKHIRLHHSMLVEKAEEHQVFQVIEIPGSDDLQC